MSKNDRQNPPSEIPPQKNPNDSKPIKDPLAPSETNPINPKEE